MPAILKALFTNVTAAVSIASRVFALYFLLQAVLAGVLAARAKSWGKVALFVLVGVAMAVIMIFGLPV